MGHHAVVHGHVHVLTLPGLAPRLQGQHYPQGRPDAGHGIAHVVPHHLRSALGSARHHHPSAHALYARIVRRPVGIRSSQTVAIAVAADAGVHQPRVNFAQSVVAETQPLHRAGTPVVQQHIGNPHHVLERLPANRVAEIQGNAQFVAVDAQVTRAHLGPIGAVNERIVGASAVSAAGTFYLYDLSAHVRQDHGAIWPGNDVCCVEDTQSVQGQRL